MMLVTVEISLVCFPPRRIGATNQAEKQTLQPCVLRDFFG